MADYSNYPQYRAASEKAQELFNRLYGFKGRKDTTGLSSAMDRVASSKGEDSPEFKKIKATFDTIQKEYEAAKAKAEAMRTEIDAKETNAKTEKEAAKKNETASRDVARLEQQRDSLRRQNKAEEAQALQTKIDAIKNSELNITGDGGKVENKALYADYTLNVDGSVTNKDAEESYFVGEPDAKGEIAQTPFTSLAKARDAFLKNYAAPGKIAELQKQLLTSGYIKDSNIKDGTWVSGVDNLIKNYTYQSVSDVKYGGVKEPLSLNSFLLKKRVGSGAGPTRYRVITTRGDAKKLLDNYMSDLIGRGATPEEESAFYDQLNAAENKAVRTTTGGTTTGSVLQEADRLMIAAKVARKTLRGSNVDELLNSNVGSTVAIDIAAMQKYAAKYGIQMTAAEALKRVADGIGQENYAAKQQERLKLVAKQLHPNLAAHIDAGGTVEDIADQYAFAKSRKLGVAIPVSTVDKDVMDAVNKGMSVSDFNIELQKKPEWRFTEEANQIADNFTNTMLKTFGLVG
jgi:hypothetical protein